MSDAQRDQPTHSGVNSSINMSGGKLYGPVIDINEGSVAATYTINNWGNIEPPTDDAARIAAAKQWLAAMPTAVTDALPAVGALPVPSRMPLQRNYRFVGREDHLRTLAQALKAGTTTAIGPVAAATGMGGIGKTQLACEFAYRYGQYFAGGVWWLSFADGGAIKAEIARCGGPTLHPNFGDLGLDEQVWLVQQAWESPLPRLLIFDNCEDETLLHDWKPRAGGCCVLLTSRRAGFDMPFNVQRLALDSLARLDSLALLRAYRPELAPDDADLDALADFVGDLPLALHLVGSFLKLYENDLTPAEYLAELRATPGLDHDSFVGEGISPTKHDLDLTRTIRYSFDRLDGSQPVDNLALRLLARVAFFAPGEPIPRDLLKATLQLPEADTKSARAIPRAIKRLTDLGLVEQAAAADVRSHRLIAAFVRAVAQPETAQADVETTMLGIANQLNTAGYPAPLLALQPHLRAVTDAAQQRADERAAGLCNALGYHLHMIGDYTGAQPYYERALAIREQALGPTHPATATSLNNLAILCYYQGKLQAAAALMQRALDIREQVLGPHHPDTIGSRQSLAVIAQGLAQ